MTGCIELPTINWTVKSGSPRNIVFPGNNTDALLSPSSPEEFEIRSAGLILPDELGEGANGPHWDTITKCGAFCVVLKPPNVYFMQHQNRSEEGVRATGPKCNLIIGTQKVPDPTAEAI